MEERCLRLMATENPEDVQQLSRKERALALAVRHKFVIIKLISVLIGVILGVILKNTTKLQLRDKMLLEIPGRLLLNMLQCVGVPLIVSSVIISVAGQDAKLSKTKTCRALALFFLTTIVSITIGLFLSLLIKPGVAFAQVSEETEASSVDVWDYLFDFVSSLFPEVLIADFFYMFHTARVYVDENGNETVKANATMQFRGTNVDGPNTLGLIVWAFIWGAALREVGPAADRVINLFTYFNAKLKDVVELIMWYLPFGMVFLIALSVLDIDSASLSKLLLFILTVILGLVVHTSLLLVIYWYRTKQSPLTLLSRMAPALLTALFISSSSATLPITMQLCERNLHINKAVSRMILPLGTNINKNGTALYEVVAVLFIAQLNSVELSPAELLIVCLIAAITSVGAPSIPASGAVSTTLVLTSVGLHTGNAALLVPVEWILDRLSTVVNVLGDIVCTDLVYVMMLEDEPSQQDPDIHDSERAAVAPVNSGPAHDDEAVEG